MASAHNTTQQKELWTGDFLLITLGNLFIFLGFQMLLPIMPVFALELGGTEAWAGMVTGIFTLASVIMRPITGRLLDRQGRKGVYLGGFQYSQQYYRHRYYSQSPYGRGDGLLWPDRYAGHGSAQRPSFATRGGQCYLLFGIRPGHWRGSHALGRCR